MSKHANTKHSCPNCGNYISASDDFCVIRAFGRVVAEPCRNAFERFWAKANQRAVSAMSALANKSKEEVRHEELLARA